MKVFNLLRIAFLFVIIAAFTLLNPNIDAAFKAGNAAELAKHFAPKVELSIPGINGTFTKAKAELEVKNFFSKHKPSQFVIIHTGTAPTNLEYVIADLSTENGSFRISYYIKKNGDKKIIQQLNIESND